MSDQPIQPGDDVVTPVDLLQRALEGGGFGTWHWDRATGITTWDERTEQLFGVRPGAFDGTYEAWIRLLHPDDRDSVLRQLDDALRWGSRYRLEHRIVSPDGDVRWIEGFGQVLADDEGNAVGTIGCCHDISERARTDLERKRLSQLAIDALAGERVQRERLELVAAVNQALETTDDLPELMEQVTRAVVPRLADGCSLHVFETEHATVPRTVITHRDPELERYATELQALEPYDPDADRGIAAVIRTGQAMFLPLIDDGLIDRLEGTDAQRGIVHDLAIRSAIIVPLTKRGRALGAMQLVMSDGHRSYTTEDLAVTEAIAARIAATIDNRRLRKQRDRTAGVDAALAALGRRLAAAAAVEEVLEVIGQDAPAVLRSARAEVALARDAESLTVVGAHPRAISLAAAGPIGRALAESDTILLERDAWDDGPADHAGALVASPLYDDVHQPMGVLILSWDEPRVFDDVDVNAIETLSRLCGQAIVRSQLAGHTEEMATVAASMAAARTTLDVARLLREHASANLGATVANVRMIDQEAATLVPVLPSELPAALAEPYERLPLSTSVPISDAVTNDAAVWLASLDAYRQLFPDSVHVAESAGLGSLAALPLHASDGTVVGAVAFAWPVAMRFDHRTRRRLVTLCDLAGQTLERVHLFEAEHTVIASMQRRLLTPLPEVEGLELAAFYEPAAAAVGMGGDWYEAIVLPDSSLVAIIGDVVGHGVTAVAAMAQIQHLLTGLLRAGTPLEELFAVADAMIAGSDPTYATAWLMHLDPVGGRLGYRSFGHPWGLLRLPDGTVLQLDANQHQMFGLEPQVGDLKYVDVPPGSLVLAYSDGLVERRGEAVDDSISRLSTILGAFDGEDLDAGLQELVARVRATDPERRATSDDIVAMLVRFGAPTTP